MTLRRWAIGVCALTGLLIANPAAAGQDDDADTSGMIAAMPDSSGARPGDDALTCDQISAETALRESEVAAGSAEINKMASEVTAGQVAAAGMGKAMAGQALSGLASMLPGVGGLIGSGLSSLLSSATKSQANPFQKKIMAMAMKLQEPAMRLGHLQMIHAEKCKAGRAGSP